MITQRGLVEHLQRRNLAAWSVVERIQDIAVATDAAGPAGVSGTAAGRPARQRRDQRTRLTLIVHQDVPRGRGSARLDISPFDTSAADLIDQAVALALATVGPAWTSTPPAAPARVDLVDPDLIKRDLGAVALGTLARLRLRRPDHVAIAATATAVREKRTVIAGSDFHATWLATALHATATLTAAGRSLTVARLARRTADFDLDPAIADAATDLALLADAGPPTPGPCALWLGPEALLHGAAPDPADDPDGLDDAGAAAPAPDRTDRLDRLDHGLWTIFARQADSAIERQGLTRYRRRVDIARGAPKLPEPLSITSDGALDFAALSAPVTDDAVAVRSFPLVDRGVAVGLGLSPREAALRHTDPNGGVRNLVVAPGTWSPGPAASPATAAATGERTLEIRRLRAVAIDPYTAEATLDVALGLEHRPGRPDPIAFTGGCIRLDLIAALALARRSSQLVRRGAYHGPAAILVDGVELIR